MGLDALANLTNVGTLVAFAIVCLTVIYLRFARPNCSGRSRCRCSRSRRCSAR